MRNCAIDPIDLVAAEVRGVDLIDVTPNMRQLWLQHVIAHYPQIGHDGRQFLAGADVMLANIRAQLPRMTQAQRQFSASSGVSSSGATSRSFSPTFAETAH